jgi:hypothetical protein
MPVRASATGHPRQTNPAAQAMHSRWNSLALATVGYLEITHAQRPVKTG